MWYFLNLVQSCIQLIGLYHASGTNVTEHFLHPVVGESLSESGNGRGIASKDQFFTISSHLINSTCSQSL